MRYLTIFLFATALWSQGKPNLPGGPVTQAADGSVAVGNTVSATNLSFAVTAYGAKGDCVTDDSPSVRLAEAAANAAGGGVVFFPRTTGCYLMLPTSNPVVPVHSHIHFVGEPGASISVTTPSGSALFANPIAGGSLYTDQTLRAFNSALKGATSLTMTTAGDAASYPAGAIVYIRSGDVYVADSSHLPNAEPNVVISSNSGTGVLVLQYPLSRAFPATPVNGTAVGIANVTAVTVQDIAFENLSITATMSPFSFTQVLGLSFKSTTVSVLGTSYQILVSGNIRNLAIQDSNWTSTATAGNGTIFQVATATVGVTIAGTIFNSPNGAQTLAVTEGASQVSVTDSQFLGTGNVNGDIWHDVQFVNCLFNLSQVVFGSGSYTGENLLISNSVGTLTSTSSGITLSGDHATLLGGAYTSYVNNAGGTGAVHTAISGVGMSIVGVHLTTPASGATCIDLNSATHDVTISANYCNGTTGNAVIQVEDNGAQSLGLGIPVNYGTGYTYGVKLANSAHEVINTIWDPISLRLGIGGAPRFSFDGFGDVVGLDFKSQSGASTAFGTIDAHDTNIITNNSTRWSVSYGRGNDFVPAADNTYGIGNQGLAAKYVWSRTYNSDPTVTTQNGTAGTAACSQSAQGVLKIATCYLNAYANTSTAQTYIFPTAFVSTPVLSIGGGSCGTFNPTTTNSTLTLPANIAMTAETCSLVLIGQ